ncbi:hypothetical protein SHK09_11290 [Polaribacter sp. PL03]|uniref:hypothetical protein n=1 Tax=Polaribacter sp. PL03 TaxID=3088353 RepID=UPI0029CC7119|nr:hypothetical protein [Polaribacter sp. PL03]MDX6747378.1 hypothetical protein [Polaribacter sp. PL03]
MKKLLFTTIVLLFSISIIQAQKTDSKKKDKQIKEKLYVKLKDGAKPDVYVDGKRFDFPIELIDQSKIEAVFVVKGEQAKKEYNALNGVILIKTKKTKSLDNAVVSNKKKPMIIINGVVSDKKTLDELKPNQIEKMEVLKGEQAIKKYNSPNGVIILTLKKK